MVVLGNVRRLHPALLMSVSSQLIAPPSHTSGLRARLRGTYEAEDVVQANSVVDKGRVVKGVRPGPLFRALTVLL